MPHAVPPSLAGIDLTDAHALRRHVHGLLDRLGVRRVRHSRRRVAGRRSRASAKAAGGGSSRSSSSSDQAYRHRTDRRRTDVARALDQLRTRADARAYVDTLLQTARPGRATEPRAGGFLRTKNTARART